MNKFIKAVRAASLTLFIFGFMGWFYIVLNAEFHAQTLSLPLTHFLPFPREDTFGAICFVVSMVSFFVWNFIRDEN